MTTGSLTSSASRGLDAVTARYKRQRNPVRRRWCRWPDLHLWRAQHPPVKARGWAERAGSAREETARRPRGVTAAEGGYGAKWKAPEERVSSRTRIPDGGWEHPAGDSAAATATGGGTPRPGAVPATGTETLLMRGSIEGAESPARCSPGPALVSRQKECSSQGLLAHRQGLQLEQSPHGVAARSSQKGCARSRSGDHQGISKPTGKRTSARSSANSSKIDSSRGRSAGSTFPSPETRLPAAR